MKWLLNFLERHGRKRVLVDFYGTVLWERWCLFYYENEEGGGWKTWLPNVFIHYYPDAETPDGEDSHRHPWNALSLVLRGSYTERLNETVTRERRAGSVAFLPASGSHRILRTEPGTWTLFFHGLRRQEWAFTLRTCENVCQACHAKNGGVCFKTPRTVGFNEQLGRADKVPESPSWRAIRWMRVDSDLQATLDRRQRAVQRMGIVQPATREQMRMDMKAAVIERRKADRA